MSSTVRPFLVASAFALLLAGCGSSGRTCDTDDDCAGVGSCVDGLCSAQPDAAVFDEVRIEPSDATLHALDGAMPSQTFQAFVVADDGTEVAATDPQFSFDGGALGALDPTSGTFVANGSVGGEATVTVTVGGLTASASLKVLVERTIVPTELGDAPARFDAATPVDDAARRAGLVYPLDGVVMPQNVYPADVQWLNGAADDVFRVVLGKPHASVTAYVAYDGANHWLVEQSAWRTVVESDPDVPASLVVDRLSGTEVIAGAPITMTFARATLTGAVYYWDIEAGRIQRIDDGSGTAVSFMPSPPPAVRGGERCVGCHSVSNSGRYMVGRLGGGENQGTVFDLAEDLTVDPAPTVWAFDESTPTWWFSTWSPDDTRIAVVYRDDLPSARELQFLDPMTGARIPTSATGPSGTHPAWSPDGTRIAYVTNIDSDIDGGNDWGGDFETGDLAMIPVTSSETEVTLGTPEIIHTGAAGVRADSYPTWSPDSARIAFANGTGSRSERDTAQLYIMNPDGSGVAQLARASSAEPIDYQPRFSPFQGGGYYWLSFLSRRVYGNPENGNSTRPESRRQQIWVTAIRIDAPAGEDPSAVPYWLPGQNPQAANISAFWARPVPF